MARWRFMCSDKWSDLEKALSQSRHWKGRSPVCFLVCLVSSSERANFQPQPLKLHMYGFSPVWVLWWAFKWLDFVYVLLQPFWGHVWITCFLLDHARRFLGFPDFVVDAVPDFVDDFKLFWPLAPLLIGSWDCKRVALKLLTADMWWGL